MPKLIDLTLTLGSPRVSAVPGLIGVTMKPLQTHESHTRSLSWPRSRWVSPAVSWAYG